jgi:hypothetical protein
MPLCQLLVEQHVLGQGCVYAAQHVITITAWEGQVLPTGAAEMSSVTINGVHQPVIGIHGSFRWHEAGYSCSSKVTTQSDPHAMLHVVFAQGP